MKLLDEINVKSENCVEDKNCPDPYGAIFCYIALMFYMVIANVLLLNLLIAMFRLNFKIIN
jgi:hypothetical protein